MQCRIADLRCKEVINVCNGHRMGYVDDVLLDVADGRIIALVVPGPCRILGIFGREDDYIIGWERIKRIGDEVYYRGEYPAGYACAEFFQLISHLSITSVNTGAPVS